MLEVFTGTGVYWYPANKISSKCSKGSTSLYSSMVDVFFNKDILRISNLKEGEGSINYIKLDKRIIVAIKIN